MQTAWSTALIPKARRVEFWRSVVGEAFLSMTPRIGPSQDFEARLDHQSLGDSCLNCVTAPAHGVWRTAADIRRDDRPLFFLNLNLTGRCQVAQAGRSYNARAGTPVLIDSRSPYQIELPDGGDLLSFAVPGQALLGRVPQAADLTALALRASPASDLLTQQLRFLAQGAQTWSDQAGWLEQSLMALLAASLAPPGLPDGPSLALRSRLRALIERDGHEPGLTVAEAARRAGISQRSLHASFAQAGTTFAQALWRHRLQWARRQLLASPSPPALADIAHRAGFKSMAHFSRRFKAAFGVAPSRVSSQWHQEAAAPPASDPAA